MENFEIMNTEHSDDWIYCEWNRSDIVEYISPERALRLYSNPHYQYGASYRFWNVPPTPEYRAMYDWEVMDK